jgi:hypothetical protein
MKKHAMRQIMMIQMANLTFIQVYIILFLDPFLSKVVVQNSYFDNICYKS